MVKGISVNVCVRIEFNISKTLAKFRLSSLKRLWVMNSVKHVSRYRQKNGKG